MRVISFCADGIQLAAEHGLYDWVQQQDADIVCIQDLQCQESALGDKPFFPEGYFAYFLDSPNGSNGVAIYTRQLPKAIMTGLGMGEADSEARYIQADFAELSICSLLAPLPSYDDAAAMVSRTAFLQQLSGNLEKVRKKRRQYILCGNWGLTHQARDRREAGSRTNVSAPLAAERQWFDALLKLGYLDAFRCVSGDEDEFSWWPEGRESGPASRIDYQIVSASLGSRVEYGVYVKNQAFSTHAPLVMDYDFEVKGI